LGRGIGRLGNGEIWERVDGGKKKWSIEVVEYWSVGVLNWSIMEYWGAGKNNFNPLFQHSIIFQPWNLTFTASVPHRPIIT
jgi:hypothetical protein